MPAAPRLINDPGDPALAPYLNQKDAWLKAPHNPANEGVDEPASAPGGRFIAEGKLVLQVLARSNFEIESVLATHRTLDAANRALGPRMADTPILVVPQALMDGIAGFHVHRGILAAGRRGKTLDPVTLASRASLLVVLEDLSNHDNVGGIFRSVAALAGEAAGVWLTPRCCDPLYRKSLRVSMGHALTVPWAIAPTWPAGGIESLRRLGYDVWGLATGANSQELDAALSLPPRLALVLGAEGPGLSRETLELVDQRVRIGMTPGVDSLNVGVACGVALHRWRITHLSRTPKDAR